MAFILIPFPTQTSTPEKIYSDPAHNWYGASGVNVNTGVGVGGDPFVFYDSALNQWVMYVWEGVAGAPFVRCYYLTATSLEGPWGGKTQMASLANYHKPVLLVDTEGAPQLIGGLYHAYATYYNGALSDKVIYHFTSPGLYGPWTLGSLVVPKGAAGTQDEFNTDTPYAVLLSTGAVVLYYMGAPVAAQAPYGIAIRILTTAAGAPDGPFVKTYVNPINPNVAPGNWDYGWLGGVQIRLRPDGSYIMVYNAGDTRPPGSGQEPNISRVGYAYAATPITASTVWTKDPANPYISATGAPSTGLEQVNIWRAHIAFEPQFNQWYLFYNTGNGVETVTYARQGQYQYSYGTGAGLDVMSPTVALLQVTNSLFNVAPGNYDVSMICNYIADTAGSSPALDIVTAIRLNGAAINNVAGQPVVSKMFVGSYAFANFDIETKWNVSVPIVAGGSNIDFTTQVTGGVPLATTKLRNLRIIATRVGTPV